MKRFGLFLLAVVMVAGLAGCNDDDDGDSGYDFSGTWRGTGKVVESNSSSFRKGSSITSTIYITQDGTDITIRIGNANTNRGTCNPAQGTFNASGVFRVITTKIFGQVVDENTLSFTNELLASGLYVKIEYTVVLDHRTVKLLNDQTAGTSEGGTLDTLRVLIEE